MMCLAQAEGRVEAIRPLVPLPVPLAASRAQYEAPITLNDAVAGTVRLELNLDYIEAGAANNLADCCCHLFVTDGLCAAERNLLPVCGELPGQSAGVRSQQYPQRQIDTCPEPEANHELSAAIRQYNATAEFLAQNTFLSQVSTTRPVRQSEFRHSGRRAGHNPPGNQHGETTSTLPRRCPARL